MATAKKAGVATKVAAKKVEPASTDLIFATAQEVENLTAPKAFALVDDLSNDIEHNSFRLGGVLSHIQEKADAGEESYLGDSKSFKTLCHEKLNIHYRKARYLIGIYDRLVEKQIPYSAMKGLGWTKIAVIAPILTQKNVEGWVTKAGKMTYIQLVEAVAKAKTKGADASETEPSNLTTMSFKLHPDQKEVVREAINKVKTETATEFDSVALANLATGYLGGSVSITVEGGEEGGKKKKYTKAEKKAAFTAMAKELGVDDVLECIGEAFPEVDIKAEVP